MNAFIVEAKRTPIGKSHKDKGLFRNVRSDQLLAELLKHFSDEILPGEEVGDVYIGCVGQHLEQGKNVARLSALLAGFPDRVPGTTINRLCGSSLQAFNFAALAVDRGRESCVLAGGVEHMHHVPMMAGLDYNRELLSRYEFPFTNMGLTCEKIADKYGITRKQQDQFALESHYKAFTAQKEGLFKREILPIKIGGELLQTDQGPRENSSMEALASLKTIFKDEGTITAGNSSPLNDGASLTLVAHKKFCQERGLRKRAQVMDFEVIGLDPTMMGLGPIPAIENLLKRNSLAVGDIDVFEINEAFASQSIACVEQLDISPEKVNPNGGGIALGHPLGCTGTRLMATILNHMDAADKELGVVSMCVGHGQGMATLIKRV